MYTLYAQNKYGEELELTHNSAYSITDIDGIDPAEAVINTTKNAGADGSVFNSAYVNDRQITITLCVNAPTEINRIALYQFFKPKFPVTLYYKNATRDVYITGYVQSMQIGFFDKKQTVQIVVNCPQPFFNGFEYAIQEFSSIDSLFEFPFSIEVSTNLLPYPYYQTTRTDSGLTYTDNGNGTITINGTNEATGSAKAFVMRSRANEDFTLLPGTYILSGGISATQRVIINYEPDGSSSAVTLAASSGGDVEFTVTEEISQYPLQVGIYSSSGTTYNNVTIYPMIRKSNVTDDTWVEYSNGIEFSRLSQYVEKSIINYGDVDTGALISIKALGEVDTPKIYNVETSESFIVNITLRAGDLLTINTRRGEKAITLLREGVKSNIIGSIAPGSTWFQLAPGDNLFTIAANSLVENMLVTFDIINQYEGV